MKKREVTSTKGGGYRVKSKTDPGSVARKRMGRNARVMVRIDQATSRISGRKKEL